MLAADLAESAKWARDGVAKDRKILGANLRFPERDDS